MIATANQGNARLPVRRWHYALAVAPPILLAVLRVLWTFQAIQRYTASNEPYNFERASEWYRLAFTWPEAALAVSLVVFVLLIAALPQTRKRAVVVAASVTSVVAFIGSVVFTFNAAFANFKEIIG